MLLNRAQEALQEKEKLTDEAKLQRRREFSKGLRVQIRKKEHDRIREQNEFFGEAIKVEDELRQRRLQLEEIKRRKLHELRFDFCCLISSIHHNRCTILIAHDLIWRFIYAA